MPQGIAVTPDSAFAYVTNCDYIPNAVVNVIDLSKRAVVATIGPLNSFPKRVKITPDGTQAWVTCLFGNSVFIIDTLTNQVVTHIFNIPGAWGIAFSPNGTRAYVAASTGLTGNIAVINTATYQVLTMVPVGATPQDVVVSPSGRHVFTNNTGGNSISQIDTHTNTLIRNITVGTQPGLPAFGK